MVTLTSGSIDIVDTEFTLLMTSGSIFSSSMTSSRPARERPPARGGASDDVRRQLAAEAYKSFAEMIANSKFKTKPKFAMAAKGHICLQDHSDRIEFRNIKIRELK